MSASKLRQYVVDNDYENFSKGVDSTDKGLKSRLWADLKQGMNLKESKRFLREAITYEETKRLFEAEDTPLAKFRARLSALSQKAGFTIEGGSSTEIAEEGEIGKAIPNEEAIALNAKYQDKESSSYQGIVGVLLMDSVLGTKFTPEYIGDYYKFFQGAFGADIAGLRVVVRQLVDISENEREEKLLALKIAWDSKVSNPHLQEAAGMKIDFAAETTEELLRTIKGEKIIITSVGGSLTPKALTEYVEAFKTESKRLGLEEKNFDTQSMSPILRQNKMVAKGNNASLQEKNAEKELNSLILAGQTEVTVVNKFMKKYGVDPKIVGNHLEIAYKDNPVDSRDENWQNNYERNFEDLGKALGVTAILLIADIAKTKIDADKKARKSAGGETAVFQRKGKEVQA